MANAFVPFFGDDPHLIVVASGVSNSAETRPGQFKRERLLVEAAAASGQPIVYFSTCSVLSPESSQSAYILHKIEMENLVKERASRMSIWRLPQVVGHSGNPHTLTNFLYRRISTGEPFRIWANAKRNLIDVSDAACIISYLVNNGPELPSNNLTSVIASPFSVSMLQLVTIFENVLNKRANYVTENRGDECLPDSSLAVATAAKVGISFGYDYIENVIRKYYE